VPQTGKVNEWAAREGWMGSFFQGVLATVLATPCSAPFLGSAMGFAFSQSSWIILVIFLSAGLGMASPYFLLALKPQWLRFVPKPGMWMENFKQLMGFFLVGTLIWVVWLVGGQVGVDGLAYLLFYLLLVTLAVWIGGRMAPLGISRKKFFVVWGAVLAVVAALSVYAWPRVLSYQATQNAKVTTKQKNDKSGLVWREYSPKRLADAREKGRVVFIKFTADWCLTCKFNEKTILASAEVEKAMRKHNVLPLTADWTGGNKKVTQLLNSFGRSSVPFYAVYPGDQGKKALTLPEVITSDMVVEAINKAASAKN
jgi:thiol:disulfide interchange protein DsbD